MTTKQEIDALWHELAEAVRQIGENDRKKKARDEIERAQSARPMGGAA